MLSCPFAQQACPLARLRIATRLGRVFSFQLQPFASGGRHLIHILLGSGDNLDVVAKKQHAVPPGIELLLPNL